MSHNPVKISFRQLRPGEMENIKKRFENLGDSNDKKPPVSPKKVLRPHSGIVTKQTGQENALKRIEHRTDEKPTISPKRILPKLPSKVPQSGNKYHGNSDITSVQENIVQKRRQSFESPQSSAGNDAVKKKSDEGIKQYSPANSSPEVQLRNSSSRVTPLRPISVAERTKLFENKDKSEEKHSSSTTSDSLHSSPIHVRRKSSTETENKNNDSVPTVRPRSRPSSSSYDSDNKDSKPIPPIKPRSRPTSQANDEDENVNSYGALWETGQSVTKVTNVPTPPVKPPRTGAHDNYMKLKLLNEKDSTTEKQQRRSDIYEEIEDTFKKAPVYRRINKSEGENVDNSSNRPLPPTRPPPPKDPPGLNKSGGTRKSLSFSGVEKRRPDLPKKPVVENNSPVYEEPDLRKNKVDINKVKHWDLPKDELPGGNMKRSYSAECLSRDSLFDDPVYVDPIKVKFMDDTEFDVYIDPSGYAIPYRHQRLQQTTSTPEHRITRQHSLEVRPISEAVKSKLGNLRKKLFHPDMRDKKAMDISKNKKKLQSVKMKINIAFAIMRKEKKTDHEELDGHGTGHLSETDSLVDEREIEKRKDYCNVVRKNTAKKRKEVPTVVYPQLFDFALVVGLEPISDEGGYRPYIIYKFPEQMETNISIPQFCFPDAGEFDVKTASPAAPSESFSFVLTNVEGEHVYGYCKRLVPLDTPAGLPEVICIISPIDAFSMYNDLLDELEEKRRQSLTMAKELMVAAFGRPMPEPGKFVHVRTLDENWETGTIFLARPQDDRVDNANRETLLSKLGVDKIIKLFSVMLLERSILFCAKNLGILSQTIHAMKSLLYPFSWPHTYIPVLPDTMLDICCSPAPYMIGILSSHLQKVLNLPLSDIFIFDLDKRQIVRSHGDEDTLLPKYVQKALKTVLNMCKVEGDLKNAQNLLISEAFLRFFIEAVGHYGNHITSQQDGEIVFEKDSFVNHAQSPSMKQFLQWFTETQMFEVFLTDKVETTNKSKSSTLNIFNRRIKEYNEELEEAKKDKKKSKGGFLKLLK